MAEIIVNANIFVSNGPTFALNQTLKVDAYDKVDVTVAVGATGLNVELQPGAAGQVQFIAILSSCYSEELTFKVNGGADVRKLDQPQLFMGKGAVSMFDPAPKTLTFDYTSSDAKAQNAEVQILVGRDATP